MGSNSIDPIAPWFVAAEQLGEYIGILFARIPLDSTKPEWHFLRHVDVDGIGGFAQLLRQRGADLHRLPQTKHPSDPSWGPILRALPRLLLTPKRRVDWQPLERQPSDATSSNSTPPPAVAWHVFDEASTTQIRHVCRKNAFTVNSFLIKHLSKAIRPFLKDESSVVPWMIPINVRGKVSLPRDTANFTSFVGVKVRSYETVADIHRNIYAALGKGEHWANWYSYKLTRPIPAPLKKILFKKELAILEWYLGSFSNLGDWDSEKEITQPDCLGEWIFAPPVLRCQLIGAGCVTFQNRLSLTIQAHPELTTSPAIAQTWVHNWVKQIQIDITSVLGEGLGTKQTTLERGRILAH